jgi:hypothetical protein
MIGIPRAHELGGGIVGLRLSREHERDLALHVQAGEIVISIFGRVDAITCENNLTAACRRAQARTHPAEVLIEGKRVIGAGYLAGKRRVVAI